MQIAKLFRMQPSIDTDFAKQASRFQPIVFGWCEDWMVARESFDKPLLARRGGSPSEFREDYCRVSHQARRSCDPLLVAARTEMIDEDRSVEDDKITHCVPKIRALRRISTAAS